MATHFLMPARGGPQLEQCPRVTACAMSKPLAWYKRAATTERARVTCKRCLKALDRLYFKPTVAGCYHRLTHDGRWELIWVRADPRTGALRGYRQDDPVGFNVDNADDGRWGRDNRQMGRLQLLVLAVTLDEQP